MPDPSAHRDDGDEEEDNTTTSTRTRWEHTGSLSALLLVGTCCATVLVYVSQGVEAPLWATATFGLATLASVAWVFGESALRAARNAKGGQ
ncbi:ORF 14 [Haloarcula hispanica virus SH1]|uniref:ORF 14 n=1 Tax=Haloarcula hispanica SH1 virus TaxID=326574 RepID=Q4KPH3_9VIRU|nr:ORF 14 [Haloarcula hispanica virus SH1]AAY24940.1 ORF 14 [Haloarcula hispanica virus SH1]